jgi:hypothetical protein
MASKKQIEANRLNAQKSTGPRSVEGKARSSMNALKTGIDAQSQTIPGEPISQLEALTDDYYERFCPTTPEQRMLVDTLVDCEWLLRRFRRVEGQMWENPIFEITFAKAFRDDSDHFARLQRRIDATQRNYRNALHELQRLQAEEAAPEPEPPSPQIETTKPEIGSVPEVAQALVSAAPRLWTPEVVEFAVSPQTASSRSRLGKTQCAIPSHDR